MSCENFRPFVGAYIDDEFDERDEAEFEAHVESCEACRGELEMQLQMKEALRESAGESEAPDALKESILTGMSEIDAERERDEQSRGRRWTAALAAIVPLGLVAVAAFWLTNAMTVAPAESGQPPAIEETVEWHRNALPLEVPGPERRHVSKWFRGKVRFPVRLPEFDSGDIELEGGRIAHIKDRRAAYLSYRVRGARMSVIIFHGDDFHVPKRNIREVGKRRLALFESDGFAVALLRQGGVTYTVTSELSEEELLSVVSSSLHSER